MSTGHTHIPPPPLRAPVLAASPLTHAFVCLHRTNSHRSATASRRPGKRCPTTERDPLPRHNSVALSFSDLSVLHHSNFDTIFSYLTCGNYDFRYDIQKGYASNLSDCPIARLPDCQLHFHPSVLLLTVLVCFTGSARAAPCAPPWRTRSTCKMPYALYPPPSP